LGGRGHLRAMRLLPFTAAVEDLPLVRIRPRWGVFRAYVAPWCIRRHDLQRPLDHTRPMPRPVAVIVRACVCVTFRIGVRDQAE
jgi:hypothetical protein